MGVPGLLRPVLRHPWVPGRPRGDGPPRARAPGGPAELLGGHPFPGHEAAALPGEGAGARSQGVAPGRAGIGAGSPRQGRAAGAAQRTPGDGQDHPHLQPHPARADRGLHLLRHHPPRPHPGQRPPGHPSVRGRRSPGSGPGGGRPRRGDQGCRRPAGGPRRAGDRGGPGPAGPRRGRAGADAGRRRWPASPAEPGGRAAAGRRDRQRQCGTAPSRLGRFPDRAPRCPPVRGRGDHTGPARPAPQRGDRRRRDQQQPGPGAGGRPVRPVSPDR